MGIILTMPTSSAAIWVAVASPILTNTGADPVTVNAMLLAGGAATVGCASHMVGFAVASFRENKWDGLFAQGIGTSMLQMPNIVKNPRIWIAPTLASAILGPLGTCVFKMSNNASGCGMGTSGLVGQIMTWQTMSATTPTGLLVFEIILLHFVLPAILTLIISELLRKKGWVKFGDMKLDV